MVVIEIGFAAAADGWRASAFSDDGQQCNSYDGSEEGKRWLTPSRNVIFERLLGLVEAGG